MPRWTTRELPPTVHRFAPFGIAPPADIHQQRFADMAANEINVSRDRIVKTAGQQAHGHVDLWGLGQVTVVRIDHGDRIGRNAICFQKGARGGKAVVARTFVAIPEINFVGLFDVDQDDLVAVAAMDQQIDERVAATDVGKAARLHFLEHLGDGVEVFRDFVHDKVDDFGAQLFEGRAVRDFGKPTLHFDGRV